MDFKLKTISLDGVEAALSKAELYRLLNEPEETESICHDVLALEPEHQLALRTLGLAITDQFTGHPSDRYAEAETAFDRLIDHYERLYYRGLLYERRAKAQLHAGRASAGQFALTDSITPEGAKRADACKTYRPRAPSHNASELNCHRIRPNRIALRKRRSRDRALRGSGDRLDFSQ